MTASKPRIGFGKQLTKRTISKASRVRTSLKRVLPEASEDVISTLSVDLVDFWEIGEEHRFRMAEIEGFSGLKDRKRLADLLETFLYRDVTVHLPYHMRSMKRRLPKLIDTLKSGRSLWARRTK